MDIWIMYQLGTGWVHYPKEILYHPTEELRMMEITNENDYYYPYRIRTTYYYEFHPYNLYLINYTYHK